VARLTRGPGGKFLPWGEEMEAWLPSLMKMGGQRSIADAVLALQFVCSSRAADALANGAAYIRGSSNCRAIALHDLRQYERNIAERQILAEAWEKLRAL
jgi:hypothetical protein